MELNNRMAAMGAASPFEVSVARISEQHGPSGFRITTLQAGGEHLEPWRVIDMPRAGLIRARATPTRMRRKSG
jgi:hypothetical protein